MLIPKSKIIFSYKEILSDMPSRIIKKGGEMDNLPPFLCSKIVSGELPTNTFNSQKQLFTGEKESTLRTIHRDGQSISFLMNAGKFPFHLGLPLDGIKLVSNPENKWMQLKKTMDQMFINDKRRLKYIFQWTSLIIWVELKNNSSNDIDLLTSSSFPDLPHTTFISDKALKHIPPNIIFDNDCYYALKENLFHEALHQEMAALLLHKDILSSNYSARSSVKIPVPWRGNAAWEADRVLHAIFVYSHILPMRFAYLRKLTDKEEKDILHQALVEGLKALSYLSRQMLKHKNIFSESGMKVYKKTIDTANNVIFRYS